MKRRQLVVREKKKLPKLYILDNGPGHAGQSRADWTS